MAGIRMERLYEFMSLIGKLKQTPRTGWRLRGVENAESISDHMYRMALVAFLAPPPLDSDKCIKMALVHDMAECIVGDLTPHDNVPKAEKSQMEEKATVRICSLLDEKVGLQMLSLWREYEAQSSPEAQFVKDLDKLDMVMQAWEYEQIEHKPRFLQEFFDSTQGKFTSSLAQEFKEFLDMKRADHRQCRTEESTLTPATEGQSHVTSGSIPLIGNVPTRQCVVTSDSDQGSLLISAHDGPKQKKCTLALDTERSNERSNIIPQNNPQMECAVKVRNGHEIDT